MNMTPKNSINTTDGSIGAYFTSGNKFLIKWLKSMNGYKKKFKRIIKMII